MKFSIACVFFSCAISIGAYAQTITQDPAQHWQVLPPVPLYYDLYCISFNTDSTGIIGTQYAHLYRTTDRGFTWDEVHQGFGAYYKIEWPSPTIGYAVCNDFVSKTTDGGATWTDIKIPYSGQLHSLSCV